MEPGRLPETHHHRGKIQDKQRQPEELFQSTPNCFLHFQNTRLGTRPTSARSILNCTCSHSVIAEGIGPIAPFHHSKPRGKTFARRRGLRSVDRKSTRLNSSHLGIS